MQRDMDLVRRILMTCADATGPVPASTFTDDEHPLKLVVYHFQIMQEAGLVQLVSYDFPDIANLASLVGPTAYKIVPKPSTDIIALTWDGQDFLDLVRSDTLWGKVKQRISTTVGSATFDVVKTVAAKIAATMIGL